MNENELKSDDDDDDETSDNYPSSVVDGTSDGTDSEAGSASFQNRHKVKSSGANDNSNNYGWIVIDQVRSYSMDGEKTGQSLFHVSDIQITFSLSHLDSLASRKRLLSCARVNSREKKCETKTLVNCVSPFRQCPWRMHI